MLSNPPFYRQNFKRCATAFMALFTDIWIQKFDGNGVVQDTFKVPIAYGPKEKWLGRLEGNPDLNKPVGISLPRMGAEIIGMSYAPDRKLNSTQKLVSPAALANNSISSNTVGGDPSSASFVFVPVPMDIQWRLDVMTQTTDDAHQIIEQIVPFFTPEWVNRVRLVDELNVEFNMPVVFQNASLYDSYKDGDMKERRVLVWSFMFTMKAYFIGPPHTRKIIKISKADVYLPNTTTWIAEANTSPGLTANGQPTTNAAASINPLNINFDQDWGYVVQIEENI